MNEKLLKTLTVLSGAEDGSQIEPFDKLRVIDLLDRLNYNLFFSDREQTEALVFQLRQLKDYLEMKCYIQLI